MSAEGRPDARAAVRAAVRADAGAIARFNAALARETEAKQLDPERLRAGVEAVFDDPARGAYYVAELDGRVAGGLLVTREWSDWRNGEFWWIQSVYVEPELRGRGVYRGLHAHVVERARAAGDVCGLRLYVERANERAKRTYEALGMRHADYDMYEVDFVLGAAAGGAP